MGEATDRIDPRAWLMCGINILFNITAFLLTVFPSVIIKDLEQNLSFTAVELSYLVSAPLAAALVFQVPAGMLMNRFGPRLVLSGAALICSLATFLFAFGTSPILVIFAQFWVGVGVCFALVGSVNLISAWFPMRLFAFILGITQAASMVCALFGNLAVARLVEWFGWRHSVTVLATLSAGMAILIALFLRNSPGKSDSTASTAGSSDAEPVTFADAWNLLRNPQTWLLGCYEGVNYGPVLAVTGFWGITELERAYRLTLEKATILDDMVFVANALGAIFFGWFSNYIGRRKSLMACAAVILVGLYTLLVAIPPPILPLWGMGCILIAIGFLASTNVLAFATSRDLFRHKEKEVAAVLVNLVGTVITMILSYAVGRLLDYHVTSTGKGPPVYNASDYVFAINAVLLACGICSVLITLGIKESYCRSADATESSPS